MSKNDLNKAVNKTAKLKMLFRNTYTGEEITKEWLTQNSKQQLPGVGERH